MRNLINRVWGYFGGQRDMVIGDQGREIPVIPPLGPEQRGPVDPILLWLFVVLVGLS